MTYPVKRNFADIEEGQIHYRTCGSPSMRPLVMFHGSPGSSFSLTPLMPHLAAGGRFVVAIDTPGNGDSSPLEKSAPEIVDIMDAHRRTIEAIGLKDFDIYGYHTGTAICTELAIAVPDLIGRVVLEGVSVFSPTDQGSLFSNNHAPPIKVDLSGTHLMAAWSMVRDAHLFWPWWNRVAVGRRTLGLPSPDYLNQETIEVLKACDTYYKSYNAALRYPKRERLPLIDRAVLVMACPSDQLFDYLDVACELIKGSQKAVLPDPHTDADCAAVARTILSFLDAA